MDFKEMHYITHKMLTNCVTFCEQLSISVLQFTHVENEAKFYMMVATCHNTIVKTQNLQFQNQTQM